MTLLRMRIWFLVLPVFIACLVPATAAAQSSLSMSVLVVTSVEGDDEMARAITDELHAAALHVPEWSVRDLGASPAQLELINNCSMSEPACQSAAIATVRSGSMIFGSIHRVPTPYGYDFVVELSRFDAMESRIVAQFSERLAFGSSAETIAALTARAIAALHVEAPASHPRADEDEDETSPTHPPAPAPVSHGPGDLTWAGISLLVVGALSLAADIGIMVRLGDLQQDASYAAYRQSFVPSQDVCRAMAPTGVPDSLASHAHGVCSEADTLEPLQFVFLVGSIVLAGTGLALILIDTLGGSHSGVTLHPHLGLQQASLDIRWHF